MGKFESINGRQAARVSPVNVKTKLREAFEVLNPDKWTITPGSGDIVQLDGNAVSASYLVVSKDPLTPATETDVVSTATFMMPFEVGLGLSLSQRTLGQEFSVELIGDETPIDTVPDIAISSIQQAASTLTVTSAAPHGLVPGKRIGIRGIASDSRMNYPALVVATTPSPTQFTATAGPGGTIPTLTVGPYNGQGFVFIRPSLGYAQNGLSMIFENASTTNASFYVRSEAGDSLPSGTAGGSHSTSVASTASVQAIASALAYAFQPSSEYKAFATLDGVLWSDVAIDSPGAPSSRFKKTQVVPDSSVPYRLRFRCMNNASLSVPNAKIVSVSKSGTTTATVITDQPHGLTTGDYITAWGTRDQTNFANLTTAALVASVINSTSFTVVWGSAVTATSFGGMVSRTQGQQNIQGVVTQASQNVARDANGILTITGSAAWSGLIIGDYVNLHGCRADGTGADIGIDGAYRVRDIQTSSLFLEPVTGPSATTVINTSNAGGAVIKRTDLRISFVRILDFDRLRVEGTNRPEEATAFAVSVKGGSVSATLSASSALAADVGVQMRSSGSAFSISRLVTSLATTNPTLVKSSAGKVGKIIGINTSAATKFLKLYNKTSAPSVGSDTPLITQPLPVGAFEFNLADIGLVFGTGIAYAITGAVADADTTALAAGDIQALNIFYL